MPISNSSRERSFYVLKKIKKYLRSTISETRLNDMAILYIEQENLVDINISKIIDDLPRIKSRKKFI